MPMLSEAQVERFVEDGFVHLPGAFPRPVARRVPHHPLAQDRL